MRNMINYRRFLARSICTWGMLSVILGCTAVTRSANGDGDDETLGVVRSEILVQGVFKELWGTNVDTGNWCVDQYAFGTANGTHIVQWPCNGLANQAWRLDNQGYIHGMYWDKCLTATGAEGFIELQPCGAYPDWQRWWPWTDSQGQQGLRRVADYNANNGVCMYFPYYLYGQGYSLTTHICGGVNAGFFGAGMAIGFHTPWPTASDSQTIVGLKNRCLDVLGYSTTNGASVGGWDCGGSYGNLNQRWTRNGTEIRGWGNKCLDAWNGGGNGAPVGMWDCNGNPWQQWDVTFDGQLINRYYGRCVDISNYNTGNGGLLQLWNCYYGGNQIFKSNL